MDASLVLLAVLDLYIFTPLLEDSVAKNAVTFRVFRVVKLAPGQRRTPPAGGKRRDLQGILGCRFEVGTRGDAGVRHGSLHESHKVSKWTQRGAVSPLQVDMGRVRRF